MERLFYEIPRYGRVGVELQGRQCAARPADHEPTPRPREGSACLLPLVRAFARRCVDGAAASGHARKVPRTRQGRLGEANVDGPHLARCCDVYVAWESCKTLWLSTGTNGFRIAECRNVQCARTARGWARRGWMPMRMCMWSLRGQSAPSRCNSNTNCRKTTVDIHTPHDGHGATHTTDVKRSTYAPRPARAACAWPRSQLTLPHRTIYFRVLSTIRCK